MTNRAERSDAPDDPPPTLLFEVADKVNRLFELAGEMNGRLEALQASVDAINKQRR